MLGFPAPKPIVGAGPVCLRIRKTKRLKASGRSNGLEGGAHRRHRHGPGGLRGGNRQNARIGSLVGGNTVMEACFVLVATRGARRRKDFENQSTGHRSQHEEHEIQHTSLVKHGTCHAPYAAGGEGGQPQRTQRTQRNPKGSSGLIPSLRFWCPLRLIYCLSARRWVSRCETPVHGLDCQGSKWAWERTLNGVPTVDLRRTYGPLAMFLRPIGSMGGC